MDNSKRFNGGLDELNYQRVGTNKIMKIIKKVKVYWNGKRLKDVEPYATKTESFTFKVVKGIRYVVRMATISAIGTAVVTSSFVLGFLAHGEQAVAQITNTHTVAPILQAIFKCESGGHQFASNGQVMVKANTNGSVDYGIAQINLSIWGKKATDMGYNLALEADNIAFAEWLYSTKGTVPWSASAKCWNK